MRVRQQRSAEWRGALALAMAVCADGRMGLLRSDDVTCGAGRCVLLLLLLLLVLLVLRERCSMLWLPW